MRLDLYQAETALIAQEQSALLDEASATLLAGGTLSRLEQNGVLHAIQVLVENAIGKAKQLLKVSGKQVPLSAYDSFLGLTELGIVKNSDLTFWNAAIGLRNRIVHDYMNIDMPRVLELVKNGQYRFITDFLLEEIIVGSAYGMTNSGATISSRNYLDQMRELVLQVTADLDCTIYLFGSRASGACRRSSDIDIGFSGLSESLFTRVRDHLLTELEESVIPHHVDLINLDAASSEFLNIAMKKVVVWKQSSHAN